MNKITNKYLSLILSIVMILSLIQSLKLTASAAANVPYIDANRVLQNCISATDLTGGSATTLTNGWYVASGTRSYSGTITVSGDVHIILANGCALSVTGSSANNAGISVSGSNSLTIYAQSAEENSMGRLEATGSSNGAGIGGGNSACGAITINGGKIKANGGSQSSGIGRGYAGAGANGTITINGGIVTATGAYGPNAGIGTVSSYPGGPVNIKGGTVTATGGYGDRGIVGTPIEISGGITFATGISGTEVTISGGTVTTTNSNGAGISGDAGGTVTISGGMVNATGGSGGAGIGGNDRGAAGIITICGGSVIAIGNGRGSGIGGGNSGAGGTITISGGIITAIGGNTYGTGLGGDTFGGTLSIDGNGVVFASSVINAPTNEIISGILFVDDTGMVYGEVKIADNVTIPSDYALTVPMGCTLTIPTDQTVTNNGIIINAGTINGLVIGNEPLEASAIIDLSNGTPLAAGSGWIYSSNVYTILNDANVLIKGTSTNQRRIEVAKDTTASITLENVSISGLTTSQAPLLLNSGANVTLTIIGNNTLTAGFNCAGILVPNSSTLTISDTSTGKLTATGGTYAAGIGGGSGSDINGSNIKLNNNAGTIIINGGEIISDSSSTAGIGNGKGGSGGTISINGGIVTATGSSSYNNGISGDTVTINGGIVTATGGWSGIGIAGKFSMNGNGIAFASSISDANESHRIEGILILNNNTTRWYGDDEKILANNLTMADDKTLVIPIGKTLIIPTGVTLNNLGTIIKYGEIIIEIGGALIGNAPIIPGEEMEIDLSDDNPPVAGNGWIYNEVTGIYTIVDGAIITVKGVSANSRRIEVATGASAIVTLENVSITGLKEGESPFLLNDSANVTVTIIGNNTLTAFWSCAGIQTNNGATLTMDGTGTLVATGGEYSAGIGGGYSSNGGTIIINSGTIIATGAYRAAGIGGGSSGAGGTIIINGGKITASTTSDGAGIGGGNRGDGGEITINGGVVTATGGYGGGAGIGSGGYYGTGGTITITGGIITAVGGEKGYRSTGGAGIGAGYGCSGGEITISGGTVTAHGGEGNEGIGGYNGTLTMNGYGLAFASSVNDMDENRKTSGILVVVDTTYWYDGDFILNQNAMIPVGYTLAIPTDKTFTISEDVIFINNGVYIKNGIFINKGIMISDGKVSASCTVVDSADIIISFYDGNKLISITKERIIENGMIEDVVIPNMSNVIKIMLWDRINNMNPLCDAKTFVKDSSAWYVD